MKTNIATDNLQSARLLRCGVSADTADMYWHGAIVPRGGSLTSMPEPSEEWDLWAAPYSYMPEEMQAAKLMEDYNEIQPAWSLSALLGLLPKEMGIAVGAYPGCDKYACFTLIDPDIEPIVADTAIEATVQMIEQLTNNGYKLNEQ